MRFPAFLPDGGTIGFVAPSFGCNIEPYHSAFLNACKKFEAMGYQTDLGPNCFKGDGIGISSTPEACGAELMEYYCSGHNDVLISCGGGELMCEVLNHLDIDALKAAVPKWYLGYSDNTNMAFLMATACDTAAIYGPCAPAFGMEPWHPAICDAFDLISGKAPLAVTIHGYDKYEVESLKDEEHPLEPYHVTEPVKRIGYPKQDAAFSGRLIGGCLDVMTTFLGTKFDHVEEFNARYADEGVIWFIESCDLNVMGIRRAIWQMDAAGWFQNVKGFLIGRPYCHGEVLFGLDQYRAVTDLLGKYNVPILMDLDIGHIPPMMPLVLGSYATAELKGNDFNIRMELR